MPCESSINFILILFYDSLSNIGMNHTGFSGFCVRFNSNHFYQYRTSNIGDYYDGNSEQNWAIESCSRFVSLRRLNGLLVHGNGKG